MDERWEAKFVYKIGADRTKHKEQKLYMKLGAKRTKDRKQSLYIKYGAKKDDPEDRRTRL